MEMEGEIIYDICTEDNSRKCTLIVTETGENVLNLYDK